ncbi:MAG TPA: IS21 family transposase [Verrucomicrobiae bacterium]
MAYLLTMADIQAILKLHEQGWPQRRIARELDVDRETVAKYIRRSRCARKPAEAPLGSEGAGDQGAGGPAKAVAAEACQEEKGIEACPASPLLDVPPGQFKTSQSASRVGEPKPAKAPLGSANIFGADQRDPEGVPSACASAGLCPDRVAGTAVSTAAISSEKEGCRSACEPYRQVILEKLEQGLSGQRVWQDLRAEGFPHEYHSVRRFVAKLRGTSPLPFRRMECEAGEEAQVDFGTGAWIEQPKGKRRKSHVFRIVLSHSRKGYSEAVYRQTTEDFIRAMENAFWHFGGVPKVLVIDNLKAAVKHPDWYDPDLTPKIQSFCEHYGVTILPTKPRTPRHKGKIESGVGYVQDNGLKGHRFTSLEEENHHLAEWEAGVADTRIHGTIRKQVGKLFGEVERRALQPLPLERFPFFHEKQRIVHRDGHVEVAKAYYSVPPEYLGHTLWVRWDLRLVRIFNGRMEQIAVHVRQEPGRFSTQDQHIAAEKRSGVERGAVWLLGRVRLIGEHAARWAENMLKTRGIEGVRVLQGLLSLAGRHDAAAIERACEVAFSHGAYRLRTIRQLLKRDAPAQETFEFLQEHPIIRCLSDYGKLVATSFEHPWERDQRPQRPSAEADGARLPNPHLLPSSRCSVSSTQVQE